MPNHQETLEAIRKHPAPSGSHPGGSISLFSSRIKLIWLLAILLTCAAELISIGPMPVVLFCLYYGMKVAAFFALGFLSPLAFQRLNGIGLGAAFSFVSALLIESFQSLSHNGHSFHWHELAGKLALISIGFALALERRYERRISVGPFAIRLQMNDL